MKYIIIMLIMASCSPKPGKDCSLVKNIYGQFIYRKQLPVKTHIDKSVPKEYAAAIYRAAATLNKAASKPVLLITEDYPSGSDANMIYWNKQWNGRNKQEQAITTANWSSEEIIKADILVNASGYLFYSIEQPYGMYNFEALMLHELGHSLGLQHTPKGFMYMYLSAHENRVSLSSEDIKNITCVY